MKAEDIFLGAVERPSPAERAAYLDGACGGDADLRMQVDGLLRSHEQAGSFLEGSLFTPATTLACDTRVGGLGTRIGPYRLLQVIGEGGMGTVYLAEQTEPVRRL